jgi:hypothetical protein
MVVISQKLATCYFFPQLSKVNIKLTLLIFKQKRQTTSGVKKYLKIANQN